MEIKSISGLLCYVQDIAKTAAFYQALGFRMGEQTATTLRVYVNWFWIDFMAADSESKAEFRAEALAKQKGAGQYLYLKVGSVDTFYEGVVAKGLRPSSEPRNWEWGNREFAMRDPDGYKLVFFEKL